MTIKITAEFETWAEAVTKFGSKLTNEYANYTNDDIKYLQEDIIVKDNHIDFLNNAVVKLETQLADLKSPTYRPQYDLEVKELIMAARNDNKIGAIRQVRTLLGYSLKEAKELVFSHWEPIQK